MTSREKFEAWWEQEKYDDKLNYVTGIMFNRIKANMFSSWEAASREQEQKLTDMAVQLANSESKCRELAAENHTARNAVQVFCDVVGENTDAICEEVGQDGVKAILAAMRATGNMPATDAFLAEVRAQGVDIARNAMIDFVDGEIGPNENVPGLIRGSEICVSISSHIRKGSAL